MWGNRVAEASCLPLPQMEDNLPPQFWLLAPVPRPQYGLHLSYCQGQVSGGLGTSSEVFSHAPYRPIAFDNCTLFGSNRKAVFNAHARRSGIASHTFPWVATVPVQEDNA